MRPTGVKLGKFISPKLLELELALLVSETSLELITGLGGLIWLGPLISVWLVDAPVVFGIVGTLALVKSLLEVVLLTDLNGATIGRIDCPRLKLFEPALSGESCCCTRLVSTDSL